MHKAQVLNPCFGVQAIVFDYCSAGNLQQYVRYSLLLSGSPGFACHVLPDLPGLSTCALAHTCLPCCSMQGPLPEDEARRFFQQLMLAVDYMHRMGHVSRQVILVLQLVADPVSVCPVGAASKRTVCLHFIAAAHLRLHITWI